MKTIHHLVDIDAPVATVWSALTEQEHMARWWTTDVEASAPAVGSVVTWTFAGAFNPVMEITTLDAERELGWRCIGGHQPWTNGTFRFTLKDLDDGRCRLRFWQDYAIELDDDAFGTYNFNWGYYLESLRLTCATGDGKPFQPPA
jgi:uncharacterized protein YndB with AHSA1/START domain